MRYRRSLAGLAAAVLGAATLTLVATPAAVAELPAQCTTSDGINVTCTFVGGFGTADTYGLWIPDGVSSAHLHVVGTAGQASTTDPTSTKAGGALGGRPAVIDADLTTSPGEGLVVEFRDNGGIGHFAGGDDTAGPYLPASGSGGGSSVVRRVEDQGGQLIAEAGGGGGGGLVSAQHLVQGSIGGNAGNAGQPGASYGSDVDPAEGGESGTANDGLGGSGATVDVGSPGAQTFATGTAGSGGKGGDGAPGDFPGGGAGGGTTAGGGGGAGGTGVTGHGDGGGGGGGSSTLPPGGTLGVSSTESSLVRISFTLDVHASYSPTSIDFGKVPVGSTSAIRDVTLTNTGTAPLPVSYATTSSPGDVFTISGNGCTGAVLDPGSSCHVGVRFRPLTGTRVTGVLSIRDGSPTSPHTVSLAGAGTVPVAHITPTQVDFGSLPVPSSTTVTRTVTLSNTGEAGLVVNAIDLAGAVDYEVTTDECTGRTVDGGQSCDVVVEFTPRSAGLRQATLTFTHNAAGRSSTATLTGFGTPPADLKVLGIGSVYTGRDHTVTRTVVHTGDLQKYPIVILNEDLVPRSYGIKVEQSGDPATAEVWSNGINGRALSRSIDGTYVTATVQPGRTVAYTLRVIPTAAGQTASRVKLTLMYGGPIESLTTETNTAAPATGTSSFELFARQGSQPYIGGPRDGQIATGPALNVGGTARFVVRLRNNGDAAAQIGLRLTDADGCSGSFVTTAAAGTAAVTADVFAGTYRTRLLRPGGYQDVRVVVRRTAPGCAARLIRAESLDGSSVVRTSYLLANAAYDQAAD